MDTAADRDPARRPYAYTPGPDAVAEDDKSSMAFLEPIERAVAAFKRMAADYALLAVLDMRRAAIQLAWLVGAGIFVTVLVVTAWLAGVVAFAVWLLGQGLSWPGVLVVAAAMNIAAAVFVAWRIRHVFENAPFAATLRQLKVEPPEAPKGEGR